MNEQEAKSALYALMLFTVFLVLNVILALVTNGCASLPSGDYNREDTQDYECYRDYGGGIGYCEKGLIK